MKRYRRSRQDALIAGVCAGIAKEQQWNPWLLRAGWLIVLWISVKLAVVAYLIAALVMPFAEDREEPKQRSSPNAKPKAESPSERVARLEKEFQELEERIGSR